MSGYAVKQVPRQGHSHNHYLTDIITCGWQWEMGTWDLNPGVGFWHQSWATTWSTGISSWSLTLSSVLNFTFLLMHTLEARGDSSSSQVPATPRNRPGLSCGVLASEQPSTSYCEHLGRQTSKWEINSWLSLVQSLSLCDFHTNIFNIYSEHISRKQPTITNYSHGAVPLTPELAHLVTQNMSPLTTSSNFSQPSVPGKHYCTLRLPGWLLKGPPVSDHTARPSRSCSFHLAMSSRLVHTVTAGLLPLFPLSSNLLDTGIVFSLPTDENLRWSRVLVTMNIVQLWRYRKTASGHSKQCLKARIFFFLVEGDFISVYKSHHDFKKRDLYLFLRSISFYSKVRDKERFSNCWFTL